MVAILLHSGAYCSCVCFTLVTSKLEWLRETHLTMGLSGPILFPLFELGQTDTLRLPSKGFIGIIHTVLFHQ